MELARLWEVIRSRKWVIIQALTVVTLVSVIGSYLITPSYQASSKILIKKAQKGGFDLGRVGLSGLSSIITTSGDIEIHKVLAASRPYIEEMVSRVQLRDEDGNLLKADQLTGAGLVSTIKRSMFPKPSIGISQYQQTDILQIRATSPDSEEAMMMANTLGEIMVDQNQTQMRAEYKSARIFLEDEMQKVKERYNTALLKITDFKKQEKTLDLNIETKLAAEKMAELLKEKEDNVIDLAQARAKLGRVKEHLAKQRPDFLSASTLQESPQIEILKKRLTELRLQLTQANTELTESHPQVRSLREQIHMAEAELNKEVAVYRSSAPELGALERQIASLEAHLKGVNEGIDKYFQAFGELPDKVFKQASLDMELNVTQQTYSSLLDSLYQIGMAEAITLSEIRVIEPAVKPLSPVSPNKAVNGALGLFLGLVFGFSLTLFMEYMDDTIRTAEDVKEFKPIALIGIVPEFDGRNIHSISGRDPNDPLYESYRRIRNYMTINEDQPISTLLITSPGPGEGKSTTVVNLGVSVAHEGKKVVILDLDLRRPSLHTYFDVPNDIGMADVLQERASADEAILSTRIEGLSVLPSGPPFTDAGGLIESNQMGRLLSHLKGRFDVVILDSAPLLVKSDALVLARYVDGSIMVLDRGRTTRRAVHESMEILSRAQIRPLGFILNRLPIEKGKYAYHQYYYGRYGGQLSRSEGRG